MLAFSLALLSWLAGRFRSRVELALEVIALRHQLAVLRRQRPGRPQLFALDRPTLDLALPGLARGA
jgi:putative transposase